MSTFEIIAVVLSCLHIFLWDDDLILSARKIRNLQIMEVISLFVLALAFWKWGGQWIHGALWVGIALVTIKSVRSKLNKLLKKNSHAFFIPYSLNTKKGTKTKDAKEMYAYCGVLIIESHFLDAWVYQEQDDLNLTSEYKVKSAMYFKNKIVLAIEKNNLPRK